MSVKMTLIARSLIVVTMRSNVTDLVTLTACKGHDRNVKTIILQRQMGPMTKYVRLALSVARLLQNLSSSHCDSGGGGGGVIPRQGPRLDVTLMRSLTSGKNNQS